MIDDLKTRLAHYLLTKIGTERIAEWARERDDIFVVVY